MLRKLLPEDREIYLRMTRGFYSSSAVSHDIDPENFEKTFDELMRSQAYANCYIVEHQGRPAGYFLTSTTYSQEAGGLVLWLEELYILPEFRNLGLGGAAIRELEASLSPAYTRCRLEVTPRNLGAAALYRRLGYSDWPYGQMGKELGANRG